MPANSANSNARTDSDRLTLSAMQAICRKGGSKSQQDPFWPSRYLYRPWTIYVSYAFAKIGISANMASLLSAVAIFAAAILYGFAWPVGWIIGAVCVQVYFILDHVDGELGRFEREFWGRKTGMSGCFYDGACHAGELALLVAIAMRLWLDLGTPVWMFILIMIMIFPGWIHPWQRYCETLVQYARGRVQNGEATLPASFLSTQSFAAPMLESTTPHRISLGRRMLSFVIQTVGFPGYWLTLLVCTILDVIPSFPRLHIGEFACPYLLIWLAVRAIHTDIATIKSTIVYGKRLRSLE